jgi:hypothetical protein
LTSLRPSQGHSIIPAQIAAFTRHLLNNGFDDQPMRNAPALLSVESKNFSRRSRCRAVNLPCNVSRSIILGEQGDGKGRIVRLRTIVAKRFDRQAMSRREL